MRYWKAGLAFLAAFIIQTSFLNVISIGGYTPNLLLCLVIVFSFLYENNMYGVVYGAVFGLIYDLCFSYVTGPTAIAMAAAAILILVFREYTNVENIINMWFISVVSIVVYYFLNWLLMFICGNPKGLLFVFSHVPWTGIYSLAVITVIYLVLVKTVIRHRKDRYFR